MRRILLIERSTALRRELEGVLSGVGHSVTAVADAVAAVRASTGPIVDLVICAHNPPATDGLATAAELRRHDEFRFVPLLLLSADASREFRRRGKSLGVTGWLSATPDPDALNAVVRELLR